MLPEVLPPPPPDTRDPARLSAALAKRAASPPIWPEEQDDRQAASLPLTVRWPLPAALGAGAASDWRQPTTVLLARVRGDLGLLTADGVPVLRRSLLGRSASRRGWQPAVIELDQPWDGTQTLTLRGPLRFSRLLLCLTSAVPKENP